jgi:hypothetical protein
VWAWSGSGKGSCCCFAYCYARGCDRYSSRDVAINTRFAGHADYLVACFHSRAPLPVNNRQSPVLPHALLLPQLLVVISFICPPGPTNGSSILELAICCSSCQAGQIIMAIHRLSFLPLLRISCPTTAAALMFQQHANQGRCCGRHLSRGARICESLPKPVNTHLRLQFGRLLQALCLALPSPELADLGRNAPPNTRAKRVAEARRHCKVAHLFARFFARLKQRLHICTSMSNRQVTRPTTVRCHDVIAYMLLEACTSPCSSHGEICTV